MPRTEFYGGQSFREWEAKCLNNPSKNLAVTAQDAVQKCPEVIALKFVAITLLQP